MNNPKTIEAIKVLYRGDIDDAPDFTYLFETSDGRYFKDYCGISLDQPCKKGGLKWRPTDPEYQLVRALCLQEPTSDEHPLHAGYVLIDGQKRELRKGDHDANMRPYCPFCPTEAAGTDCRKCNASLEAVGDTYLWLSPPPAPVKEPEWEAKSVRWGELAERMDDDGVIPVTWSKDKSAYICRVCNCDYCPHAKAVPADSQCTHYIVTRKQQGAH